MTERDIFDEALDVPPSKRHALLTRLCGPDMELRRRVEALLDAHAQAGGFLEQPARATTPPVPETLPTAEGPGAIIAGRYKLIRKLGEGGMGEVWLAYQSEPLKRQVALKLIKSGSED